MVSIQAPESGAHWHAGFQRLVVDPSSYAVASGIDDADANLIEVVKVRNAAFEPQRCFLFLCGSVNGSKFSSSCLNSICFDLLCTVASDRLSDVSAHSLILPSAACFHMLTSCQCDCAKQPSQLTTNGNKRIRLYFAGLLAH